MIQLPMPSLSMSTVGEVNRYIWQLVQALLFVLQSDGTRVDTEAKPDSAVGRLRPVYAGEAMTTETAAEATVVLAPFSVFLIGLENGVGLLGVRNGNRIFGSYGSGTVVFFVEENRIQLEENSVGSGVTSIYAIL